jgi:Putative Actinobacterial Holin-X, holin superfamily III
MAERLKDTVLVRVAAEVVSDLADLIQKEVGLARAETSRNLSKRVSAGIWFAAAAGLGIMVAGLLVAAVVSGLMAATQIPLYWSCLIWAGVFAIIACGFYAKARADTREEIVPRRTLRQVKQDIATMKDRLS